MENLLRMASIKNAKSKNHNNPSFTSSYTRARKPLWTITYDDESKNIYDYAFPVHQSENVPAEFYIVPNRIGLGGDHDWGIADTWPRVKEMHESTVGQIRVQHHTVNHVNATLITESELRKNIEDGLEIFAENGIDVNHFAYPGGSNNSLTRNVLKDYFVSASTTYSLDNNKYTLNPQALNRSSIDDRAWESTKAFLDKAVTDNAWLITYQHAVHPSGIADKDSRPCMTPDELIQAIQYAKSVGIEIVTLDVGLSTFAPYIYLSNETTEPIFSVQRDGIVVQPATL